MKKRVHIRMAVGQGQFTNRVLTKTKEIGLLPGQPKVMEFLSDHDGCTQKDVCEAWDLDKSTVSGLIDRMERDGLLVIEKAQDDRRKKILHLTEYGHEKWSVMKKYIDKLDKTALEGVSLEEQEVFFDILERMFNNIKNMK